jgi:hypothetical protein
VPWYQALHGTRILIELATLQARGDAVSHPFVTLEPAAATAVRLVTGP